jgi:transcriptional regulator with GAF, ATPase, and Fis domain
MSDTNTAVDQGAGSDRNSEKTILDPETRYKALLQVNNAIVNETSRENLFRSMAMEIRKIFRYDRFSISIYDRESACLTWFAVAKGITVKSMDSSPRSLDKGPIAQAVITSRQPLIIQDMNEYSHWSSVKLLMDAGIRATMCFPLITRGEVLGALHFSFKKPPERIEELARFLVELSGQVALAVDNMLSHTQLVNLNASLEQQKLYLLKQVETQYGPERFFYSSRAMREIMRQVQIISDSDASVLITGETGTGKDCIARYIHHLSRRRSALFVKVNCPALSEALFESELFGHVKGAFTGASSKRVGRFEMADGGTVFLDEIGELSMALQAKLLHVLQDRRFERVGDSRSIEVSFRVVAATNTDIQSALREKRFRSDLFYRLNTFSFHVPPLRERVDEIEPLVRQLTQSEAENLRRIPPEYSSEVMEMMRAHPWPGNVRELKNIVNRLIIVFSGRIVTKRDIEPLLNTQDDDSLFIPMTLDEVERAHLIKALTTTKGTVGGQHGAAKLLKIPKSTLQYKLRTHGLNPKDFSR